MRYTLVIILLFFIYTVFAQDSLFKKKHFTAVDIETFYSYYSQDGDHSAVTGGIGTEKLHVHSAGFNVDVTTDTSHTIIVETYIDAITSASVDNINFVVSSASYHDNHLSAHIGYQYSAKKKPFLIGGKYMFGMESDFLSHGISLWTSFGNKLQNRHFSLAIACFFDDLRWGRLSESTGYKPTTLIYPYELRYKQWFDIYRRNSYNLNIGLRQDINRKLSMQLDLGFILQKGLISTSFHRIFFYDSDSGKVENLPRRRLQFPVGFGLNYFLNPYLILKAYYSYYWDDIGINAHAVNLELPVKINYQVSLYPFFRLYHQTASIYFKPFSEHSVFDEFYTSDYDLSGFFSYKLGLGFGYYPDARFGKSSWSFNNVVFRYAYYSRSDGLDAHMLTFLLNFKKL